MSLHRLSDWPETRKLKVYSGNNLRTSFANLTAICVQGQRGKEWQIWLDHKLKHNEAQSHSREIISAKKTLNSLERLQSLYLFTLQRICGIPVSSWMKYKTRIVRKSVNKEKYPNICKNRPNEFVRRQINIFPLWFLRRMLDILNNPI